MDVDVIKRLGVSAVLNCASMGIRGLPLDAYEEAGIEYNHTNVKRDEVTYPILHQPDGERSDHLKKAAAVYDKVRAAGGTALFFCVAGQNRSATLAVAVQMLRGVSLDGILAQCSTTRPFICENKGFQRQLVELEGKLVPPAPRGAQAHRFKARAACRSASGSTRARSTTTTARRRRATCCASSSCPASGRSTCGCRVSARSTRRGGT